MLRAATKKIKKFSDGSVRSGEKDYLVFLRIIAGFLKRLPWKLKVPLHVDIGERRRDIIWESKT